MYLEKNSDPPKNQKCIRKIIQTPLEKFLATPLTLPQKKSTWIIFLLILSITLDFSFLPRRLNKSRKSLHKCYDKHDHLFILSSSQVSHFHLFALNHSSFIHSFVPSLHIFYDFESNKPHFSRRDHRQYDISKRFLMLFMLMGEHKNITSFTTQNCFHG